MADMFNLIRQAQAMKEKMAQFQKELEAQSFTGKAGAVTITMNGKHEVQQVEIDPKVAGDVDKLQKLILEAVNDAGHQVNTKLKAEIGKMTGGLGLPGMF